MGTPSPKFPLENHCSVIHENTLYVYSPAGFQSLGLHEGAQWEALPMDISLTGAQCVLAAAKGEEGAAQLYIVGGAVNATAADWKYPGLMYYTFATHKWDWLRSESWTTSNRQNHAAAYLAASKKILVYAGSQTTGDVGPSTQSFLMSTQSPFTAQSLPSAGAPPSVNPILLTADDKSVFLVGGGATNKAIWKFDEAQGWRNTGVTLQQPITNQNSVQCSIVTAKDGSVVLEMFDMGVVPNKVERILVFNKDGSPAAPGTSVGKQKVKRAEVSAWSNYNGTYAPKSTRSGYSLAQGADGLTAATGGSQTDPLVLFDAQANAWLNATELFAGQHVLAQSTSASATSSTTPTATASPTPSSTAAPVAPPPPSHKGKMLTVLGITLGTIFGIAAILILLLFCLKYRKNKQQKAQGYIEKDRMSFADRGADFMKEAGGSIRDYHHASDSVTSLAIIQGRPINHRKNQASDASTAGLMKKPSPLGYQDSMELSKFDIKSDSQRTDTIVRQNSSRVPAAKPTPRERSSGWSRYFANNEATNLVSGPPDRNTYTSDTTSTANQSQYTSSRLFSHPSQYVAPLQIPQTQFDGQRLSRVASGSPTLGVPTSVLPQQVQPMQAELSRANSNGSSRSGISGYDDHYYEKPVHSWTPVGDNQRSSSNYTGSMVIDPNSKYDVTSSYYPDKTDTFYSKSNFSSFYADDGNAPNISSLQDSKSGSLYPEAPRLGVSQDRDSSATLFPGGPSPSHGAQTKTRIDPNSTSFYLPSRPGHESTVTMFPGPELNHDSTNKGHSDMSWLNLGRA